MIERHVEFTRLEVDRVGCCCRWVDFEVIWLVFCYHGMQCTTDIGEESVVLLLDSVGKDIVALQEVAIVDVEGCELIFAHRMYLFDVYEFAVGRDWDTAVRSRSRSECYLFSKAKRRTRQSRR